MASYEWFVLLYSISGVITFFALLFVSAPYGRHIRTGWGPAIPSVLGWIFMESPGFIGMAFWATRNGNGPIAEFFIALWGVHYLYRSSIFPALLRNKRKPIPAVIPVMGMAVTLANSYINGEWLAILGPRYSSSWLQDPRFIIGIVLFSAGFMMHVHADRILVNLRQAGTSEYKIPNGGLYRWITCPNYFGELVQWSGWAIATWSPAALVMVLWSAANLVPRAVTHHRWYKTTFTEYPMERRAIFPALL